MKNTMLLVFSLCLVTSCVTKEDVVELFVSQHNTGIENVGNEVYFKSIEEAIQKAELLKAGNPTEIININILPGEYNLSNPIVIPASLSGVSLIGTKASEVHIKGSKPLTLKWKKFDETIYVTSVPEGTDFDQFIVNGTPQIMARYPNYDESAQYWQGYASDAISKERVASWKKPEGAYFNALHKGRWGGYHFEITGVNEDGSPILKGGHQNNRPSKPHEEYRMVENVFEELDSPGEWYLDKEKRKLYFWPLRDVTLETSKFEVSILKELVKVVGSLEAPVKDVTISGITFENTRRTIMETYEPLLRSDWTIYRGGVLFFEGTENCTVSKSEFTNLGGNVIMASKYNMDLNIIGNHIHDCGASAISFIGDASAVRSPSFNYKEFIPISEMDSVSGPMNDLYPRNCLVEDNLIHRIGRIEKQTAGVQISMAMDIRVSHNTIYDVPRAGINIGDGTWGGHTLEYNDVFNTVLETSDHGSFNSWGRDRFWHPNRKIMDSLNKANPNMHKWDAIKTTIIRNNRFRCDHGWDIDLDDGSSNYYIYNNLCLNNGIKLREGFKRVVENNIMVNNSLHPHVWFANSEDVFRNNIVAMAYQDVGLKGWGNELDYNLFLNEESLMKSQIYDRDAHSAFGDPQFKDPASLDFTVAPDSKAIALGFKNFPMDEFGVMNPDFRVIAKTPEIPEQKDPSTSDSNSSPVVAWLRNSLKSVDSEQEQSAYGLNSPEGVIILKVWNHSPAVQGNGLKKGDVILKAAGNKVKNVKEFFQIISKYQNDGTLNLVVMRNQAELEINIKTK